MLQPMCLRGCGDPPTCIPCPAGHSSAGYPPQGGCVVLGRGGMPPHEVLGRNLSWVASHRWRDCSWAGKRGGSRGSPGRPPGTPLLEVGGSWGCLSLHWLQGEPRHRAKPRRAFNPWMKVGKAYGDNVLPRWDLPAVLGTAGPTLPNPKLPIFSGEVQHPSTPGRG